LKKTTYRWLCLVLSVLFLGGCQHRPPEPAPAPLRLVTSIHIACYRQENLLLTRQYTQTEKIRSVLDYLRFLFPSGSYPEVSASLEDPYFKITLFCSDGSQKQYWQLADRYLKEGTNPWQTIDPEKALLLQQLLDALDSDTEDAEPFFKNPKEITKNILTNP